MRRVFAAAFAVALLASSLDVAWTVRTAPVHAAIDPSLSVGEVALVRTTAGHAGALSVKLAELGAIDIRTDAAADTVIARLSNQALAAIATDQTVRIATRDIAIVALGDGRSGYERDDSDDPSTGSGAGSGPAATPAAATPAAASPGVLAIRGPQAWTRTTGDGVTVAVMDTGIAEHPDLARGKVRARVDFVQDGGRQLDPGGHGTFIAGVIAANGAMKGVAPDAGLVSLRVLDASGNGTLAAVVDAFNWLLQHRNEYRIKVLNVSWGAPQTTSYHNDLLSALVESAWFSGIAVVASAGNAGPGARTVTAPASDPFVISVGSFGDQGTTDPSDDRESSFSGRGPTLDGFAKPDTLAPGEHIRSLRVPGLVYLGPDGQVVGSTADRYVKMTGTSAAAAFVSGVAALVAAARPGYGPTQLKGAIVASGRQVTGSSTTAVDAANALVSMTTVNVGLEPSRLLLALLARTGQLQVKGVTWDGVTWEGVTWDGVTWESVSWESITWEGVTWEGVTWQTVRTNTVQLQ